MEDYRESEEGKRRFANPDIYQKTLDFQTEMGKLGIAWHNHYADECTMDFSCCAGENLGDTNYHTFIPSFRTATTDAVAYDRVRRGLKGLI